MHIDCTMPVWQTLGTNPNHLHMFHRVYYVLEFVFGKISRYSKVSIKRASSLNNSNYCRPESTWKKATKCNKSMKRTVRQDKQLWVVKTVLNSYSMTCTKGFISKMFTKNWFWISWLVLDQIVGISCRKK